MIIRRETSADLAEVREIVCAAFGRGDGTGPSEAPLLDDLRACTGWIPALSLVAVTGEQIVGHAVCTRGFVGDVACVGLGPIAVAPALQRAGVGGALMNTMPGVADGRSEPLVALLGSPDYYSRFGFVASVKVGVRPPDDSWGAFFQVRTLSSFDSAIAGTFEYAEPFSRH